MPNTIKASYVFSGPDHGWRETWYFQQTDTALSTAYNTFNSTVPSRRLLLGAQASIKAIEVSVELDAAGQPVLNDSLPGYIYQQGFQSEDCADLDLAVLTLCASTGWNRRRFIYLRGFWDSIEVQGGKYVPPPGSTWTAKYNSWVAAMNAIFVGWLTSTKSAPFPITGYTQQANGQVRITFAGPGPWAAGVPALPVQIRINTARQPSKLSGLKVVQPLTATTCDTIDKIAVFPFTGVGWRAFVYTKAFVASPNITPQRIAKRGVGRPLLVSRGRAGAAPLG